jgi:hypothetical protein
MSHRNVLRRTGRPPVIVVAVVLAALVSACSWVPRNRSAPPRPRADRTTAPTTEAAAPTTEAAPPETTGSTAAPPVAPTTTAASRPAGGAAPLGVATASVRADGATCLSRNPATVADYRAVFATRNVWSGGDGAHSVDMGDGRVLWLFMDTFVDGLNAAGEPGPMVRNSLVVQSGRCFSLVTAGTPGQRQDPLPATEPGEWLWPTGAVMDPAGAVKITAMRMVPAPGPAGWDWRINGVDVVTLRHSDLGVVSSVHAPVTQDGEVKWGGGTFKAYDGHVYIYGWRQDHQVVARTTMAGLDTQPWELLANGGWTTDREAAVQPQIDRAPAAEFWVIPHRGGYLASSKSAEMESDDVSTWFGPSPIGPFRKVGRAANTAGKGSPWITYMGRVTELPGAGLVTVWSQNQRQHSWPMDARPYGPQFAAPLPGSIP